MTDKERQRIDALHEEGNGYKKIARVLDISPNTVKSYLRRKRTKEHTCLYCGKLVTQTPGKREKKFCSDECRSRWWNAHKDQAHHRNIRTLVCPVCGKQFEVFRSRERKYCSHECYIAGRFG